MTHFFADAARQDLIWFHGRKVVATWCLWVALVVCLGFGPAMAPAYGQAQTEVATVLAVTGGVQLTRGGLGAGQALRTRLGLYVGDVVETTETGKTSLLFSDGTQLRLGASTRVVITPPVPIKGKSGFLKVLAGQVWARLRPGRAVQTRYSNLSVRGTDIMLNVAADGTDVLSVLDGSVDFFNDFGAVVVAQNQQSTARPGQPPTPPVTIDNPGFLIEWTNSLNFSLPPYEPFVRVLDPVRARAGLSALRAANVGAGQTFASGLQLGDALLDARDYQGALTAYAGASQLNAASPEPRLRAVPALLQLGRFAEADALLLSILGQGQANLVIPVALAPDSADGHKARAHTLLAWSQLAQGKFPEASASARAALQIWPTSVDAAVALGYAAARSGREPSEARGYFEAALKGEPEALRYQAHLGLAGLDLAAGDAVAARQHAALAVRQQPGSALAEATLAMVEFRGGNKAAAERHARVATRLDPLAPASQLALAQALLINGKAQEAGEAAARAVALDDSNGYAYFLLGVADTNRRDYRHGAKNLQESLKRSPNDPEATSLLARLYTRMGREKDALALLAGLEAKAADNHLVWAAIGEAHQGRGDYKQGLAAYAKAVKLRPDSAFAQARYARLAIDANQLNTAIIAGQKAVQLAPEISEYHSILGLAYSYSRLTSQAQREFRTALALDPRNALALVQLGLGAADSDSRLAERTTAVTYVQGFMLDPGVAQDLLRPGVALELKGTGGDVSRLDVETLQRALDNRAQLYLDGNLTRNREDRPNNLSKNKGIRADLTVQTTPDQLVYAHIRGQKQSFGVPGKDATPSLDDNEKSDAGEAIISLRQTLAPRTYLWGSLFSNTSDRTRSNPNRDGSMAQNTNFNVANVISEAAKTKALMGEVRVDMPLVLDSNRPGWFTLGASRPRTKVSTYADFFTRGRRGDIFGNERSQQTLTSTVVYAQASSVVAKDLFLSAQLQRHRQQTVGFIERNGGQLAAFGQVDSIRTFTLPSALLSFQADKRTALRFSASRRVTEVTQTVLPPVDGSINSENVALPVALPLPGGNGHLTAYQLDLERYGNPGELWKLFAFHSKGRNLQYRFGSFASTTDLDGDGTIDPALLSFDRISRTGLGARYERQVGRSLFALAEVSYNSTKAHHFVALNLDNANFEGQQAPYHPRTQGKVAFNYLTNRGTKAGLTLNYHGSYLQSDNTLANPGAKFASRVTADLLLAHEPNIETELFLQVRNLLNTRQIIFNGISYNSRQIQLGLTRRFR